MTESAANAAPPRKRGLWVQGALCGAAITFATPSVLLLAVLLAPAALCGLAEPGRQRGTVRAVTLCGTAAAVAPLWDLWMAGERMEVALALLSNPLTLVVAWGAGACAWAACQVLPLIFRSVWDLREAARARGIEAELAQCRGAWDLPEAK